MILLRFLKLYSKSQRITVCLCVIVKMAKMKDEGAERPVDVRLAPTEVKQRRRCGEICGGFFYGKVGGQMPRKPKKPCAYPGCPNLTEGRYCPEHQSKVNSEYEKYGRDPRTKKRYGRAWKRIRDKYVQEHPFCELCFRRGIIVETEEVHHRKPLSEGGTHDRSNLIALCKSCHSRIHAERGDRWGKHPEGE